MPVLPYSARAAARDVASYVSTNVFETINFVTNDFVSMFRNAIFVTNDFVNDDFVNDDFAGVRLCAGCFSLFVVVSLFLF